MTKREPAPLIGEYLDVAAMAAAAEDERLPRPVRLAGDRAGSATPAQVRAEQVRRDLADRLGMPDGEAA